jgi:hypothetical protein
MRSRENPLVKVRKPDGTIATMFKKEAIRAGLLEPDYEDEIETKEVKPSETKNED